MKMSQDKKFLIFTMYSGVNYEESNKVDYTDTSRQVQRTHFSRQEMVIAIDHYEFEKTEVGRYSDQAKSMTLKDLVEDQDSIRTGLLRRRSEQLTELRHNTNALFYNKQLDTSRANMDRSVFPLDSIRTLELADDIAAHKKAINRMNTMISYLMMFDRDIVQPATTLKLIDIEVYKKFSLALVCFLLFFIGAPLGALIRKGGLGTPAIISVLFFVLYYIVDIVGTKLSRDGAIEPFTGAFIASYVLLPIGAFFTYKAINDEPILATDNLKNWFVKTKIKVMEFFHKTNIVYMGTPEFAVEPLRELLDKGFNVVGVVTVPDKPSGRGLGVNESAVKKFAVERGLPVLQPDSLKDPSFIAQLKAWKPDIITVVAFRILPREVFSLARLGAFNLHAALLPQYRGAAPINWAVINGEKATGVTSFLLDDGVDTGTILIREQYKIGADDCACDVHDALMEMGTRVVLQTVEGLIEGHLDARVQKSFIQGEEVLHKAPKLTKELCHIDWNDTPEHIVNLIRGLSDYPGAYTNLVAPSGETIALKIFRAHIEGGKVIPDEVQLAGKKRMSYEEFLRGFRDFSSYHFDQGTSREVIEAVHRSERVG